MTDRQTLSHRTTAKVALMHSIARQKTLCDLEPLLDWPFNSTERVSANEKLFATVTGLPTVSMFCNTVYPVALITTNNYQRFNCRFTSASGSLNFCTKIIINSILVRPIFIKYSFKTV